RRSFQSANNHGALIVRLHTILARIAQSKTAVASISIRKSGTARAETPIQVLDGGEPLPGGSPSACHRSGTSRFWERLLDAARTLALIKSRIFCSIYGVTRFSNHGFAPCRQGNLSC